MAAPRGNKFWKLRSKHGRNKLFKTPKLLLLAAEEYFGWCDNNPWMKNEQLKKPYKDSKGKWQTVVQIPAQRPYTLSGFGLYCHASEQFLTDFERSLQGKEDKLSKDFISVIRTIRATIDTQQMEGATVGAFNANIIARKLGLADKQDVTSGGQKIGSKLQVEIVPPTEEEDDEE